jgi:hypothetical protein
VRSRDERRRLGPELHLDQAEHGDSEGGSPRAPVPFHQGAARKEAERHQADHVADQAADEDGAEEVGEQHHGERCTGRRHGPAHRDPEEPGDHRDTEAGDGRDGDRVALLVLGERPLEGEPGDHAVEVAGLEGAEPRDQDTDGHNRQARGKRMQPQLDRVVAQAPVDGSHPAPDRDPHEDREHDRQVGGGGAEVEAKAAIVEAAQGGPHQDHGRAKAPKRRTPPASRSASRRNRLSQRSRRRVRSRISS